MSTMYVVPAEGLKIVDPVQYNTPAVFLPPEGREVDANDYWRRRVRDGDVTIGEPPVLRNLEA